MTVTDFSENRVVKFQPSSPPEKREPVLVNGERGIVKKAAVSWVGDVWTLTKLVVVMDEQASSSPASVGGGE